MPIMESKVDSTGRRNTLTSEVFKDGDGLDNAMMESFWSSMQIELLNRKKWQTRIELANAIFEYIEVFYNRQRRHSALSYATPHEYDLAHTPQPI